MGLLLDLFWMNWVNVSRNKNWGFLQAEKIRNTLEQEMVFFARLVGGFQVADSIIPIKVDYFDMWQFPRWQFSIGFEIYAENGLYQDVSPFFLLQIGIVTVHNLDTQAGCTGFRKLELWTIV